MARVEQNPGNGESSLTNSVISNPGPVLGKLQRVVGEAAEELRGVKNGPIIVLVDKAKRRILFNKLSISNQQVRPRTAPSP